MKRSYILVAVIFFLAGLTHATAFGKTSASASEKKLIAAAEVGDLAQVKKLVAIKTNNLNAQDQTGATALMLAAINGNLEIVNFLIKAKANLELKSNEGETALTFAVSNDQSEIATALINAGANTNVTMAGDEGDNILIRSVLSDKKLRDLVLKKNPQLINKKNKLGETALFQAARFGTADDIQYLVKNGANKSVKNSEGKTALDVAKAENNTDTIKALSAK